MWSVYTLADPRTGAVRYLGETIQSARGKVRNHVGQALAARRVGSATPTHDWILDLVGAGLLPEIRVVDWYPSRPTEKGQRLALERQWIEAFVEAGHALLNIKSHPAAPPVARMTWEDRAKRLAAARRAR